MEEHTPQVSVTMNRKKLTMSPGYYQLEYLKKVAGYTSRKLKIYLKTSEGKVEVVPVGGSILIEEGQVYL